MDVWRCGFDARFEKASWGVDCVDAAIACFHFPAAPLVEGKHATAEDCPRDLDRRFVMELDRDLYITTANVGMSDESRTAAPTAGGLFVARDLAQGRLPEVFAG